METNKTKVEGKKLGILGGMGSLATAYFFKRVVESTVANNDQEHIESLIFNCASMPDRTKAILSGETSELLSKLKSGVKVLADWGADNIAIPCNTSHFFYNEIQASTPVPIINMVRETIDYILNKAKEGETPIIGLLATDGTVQSKVYESYCKEKGLQLILPSPESQKKVMSIIYDEVKSGKPVNQEAFEFVLAELRESGATKIILACTELSVIKDSYTLLPDCIDALEVLVMKAVQLSGKKYQGPLV